MMMQLWTKLSKSSRAILRKHGRRKQMVMIQSYVMLLHVLSDASHIYQEEPSFPLVDVPDADVRS